jgi:hypothetical protein
MDVEIEHGDALHAMFHLRVARADRDIVEQAEATRNAGRGVVAGRAHRRKGGLHLAFHHRLDAGNHRARRTLRRLCTAAAHHRVAIDMDMLAGARTNTEDRLDIVAGMHPGQFLHRGERCVDPLQAGESGIRERCQNGAQPVGPFGMVGAGIMLEECRMADQQCGHATVLGTRSSAINR